MKREGNIHLISEKPVETDFVLHFFRLQDQCVEIDINVYSY